MDHVCVFSTIVICLCYCYFIPTRIPKVLFRLISIFPILCTFTILPLYLPRIFNSVITITLLLLLTNCKLILLAFGKGPLSPPQTLGLYNFIIHGALPVQNPCSKLPYKPAKKLDLGIKFLSFAIHVGFIAKYRQIFHPKLLQLLYGCFFFLYVDLVWTTLKLVLHALFGMEIETVLDEPLLSTSLHEFWGRRWNIMTSNMLGQVVFDPVRASSAVLFGRDLARIPAYLATFLVSGLFHELMLYCLTRENPTWEMTAYFVSQGIGMALESRVKRSLNFPRPVFIGFKLIWTIGFVTLLCLWLFYPPVTRGGVDTLVIGEFRSLRLLFSPTEYKNSLSPASSKPSTRVLSSS